METVVIIVHLMIVIALIATVLLQRSEGGALGMGGGGGGGNFMTGRGTANALTRTTGYLALGFFATSITLAVIAQNNSATVSPFDTIVPAGDGNGVLGTLEQLQGDAPATAPVEPQVPTSQ